MTPHTLNITGMMCGHCVRAVLEALQTLPDIVILNVTIGQAQIKCSDEQLTEAVKAIQEEGYEVSQPHA